MKDIRETVRKLAGRWSNKCYAVLCLAVENALELPHDDLQLKVVLLAVSKQNGHNPEANSRALARAAQDIWERGDHAFLEEIFARKLENAPSAKELLCMLTEYIRPTLSYRCWESDDHRTFGIVATEDSVLRLVTEPFSEDADFVRALARRLSIQQQPVDIFRTEFLTGQILKNQVERERQKRKKKPIM